MNNNFLLDREFFNINTRCDKEKKEENKKEKQYKKQENNIPFLDHGRFNDLYKDKDKDKEVKKYNFSKEEQYSKINNYQFNDYQTQYKNMINVDRIGFNNNNKEQKYYSPYDRNIHIEKKNINGLDFIDKTKKNDYYKNINLKKFNPDINYKDFI